MKTIFLPKDSQDSVRESVVIAQMKADGLDYRPKTRSTVAVKPILNVRSEPVVAERSVVNSRGKIDLSSRQIRETNRAYEAMRKSDLLALPVIAKYAEALLI
ncbi:MAG: hypothetical protein WCX30_02035 [Candidatus Paceibacterota bacterium]|jgi:hypothetical protein